MIMEIVKRDGRREPFAKSKIITAITHAMERAGQHDMDAVNRIADEIANLDKTEIGVEEVQDMVELKLMKTSLKPTAKEYITYRERRTIERNRNNAMNRHIENILLCKNVQNSNANVDEHSFGGRKFESANVLHKDLALHAFMRPEVAKAHEEFRIYMHDLSEYTIGSHNCLFADLQRLLNNGFSTRNGDVRPAGSFATACQLVAVIFQIQSQVQFGGVASAHIDDDLAPFVVKSFYKHYKTGLKYFSDLDIAAIDNWIANAKEHAWGLHHDAFNAYPDAAQYAYDMLEQEGRQAAQSLFHNLNTLESRAGSQIPFTSLNYGLNTTPEGRMVTRWLLEASLDGIGKYHMTPIFPIGIFKHKKGVNARPGDPNYDLKQLAMKSLSRRIYPNWVNCDFSENIVDPNDPDTEMATMGCRTMLGYDRHGMGYKKTGRGNVCPVTMNLPKLGIKHGICLGERTKADLDGFWAEFNEVLALTETALLDRFYHVCAQSVKAAPFMYTNGTVADSERANVYGIYEAMRHGTLAIGYVGLAEMCRALFGVDHSEDDKVNQFAYSVVEHISKYAKGASERNNLNFSCYATPAESLCKTYAKALRDEFGEIANITNREYITNSHHVPVWQTVSIYKKLQIEAPFCKFPTGGCITYIELDSAVMQNPKAIESIIDYAMSLNVPYLALNFPIDTCLKCGYSGEIEYNCPACGNTNIQRLRRVTGYLSSDYRQFNAGKIAEVLDRVKHNRYTDYLGGDTNGSEGTGD